MLFCTSGCCSAVALAVLCQCLQKFFWFSSKQLQILTFVFYSLIGKSLECPKALPPLAMSGSFWPLGCGDGLKSMLTGLKAVTFSSSGKASVRAGKYLMYQALRKTITAGEEDRMSTVWPSSLPWHTQSLVDTVVYWWVNQSLSAIMTLNLCLYVGTWGGGIFYYKMFFI